MIRKLLLAITTIKNIHILILDYLGYLKGDIVYVLWNGFRFAARAGSTDYSEIIINNGDSEYPSIYFPKTESPIIIDLGANIGETAIFIYKKLLKNNPTIYAIEPNSNNYKYLEKNIKINNIKNILPFKLAITKKTGHSYLNFNNNNYDGGFVDGVRNKKLSQNEKILTMTLEYFCKKYKISQIDLVKIDIEGSEYEVFEQSLNYIKKHVKSIFVELHNLDNHRNYSAFKKYIIKHNFSIGKEIMNRTLFLRNTRL